MNRGRRQRQNQTQSFTPTRSSSRRGRFRGGYSGRAQMEEERNQARDRRQSFEQPATEEAIERVGIVEIQPSKTREAIKAPVRKINLEKYFRDWLEEERKNVMLDFNINLESEINRLYEDKVTDVVTKRYHSDEKVPETIALFKSGISLAIGMRLILTAAQSQQNSDLVLKRLTMDLKIYKVPDSYNVMLQAMGKMTDDAFGNVRIMGALVRAKQKILDGMKHAWLDDYEDEFNFVNNDGRQTFVNIVNGNYSLESVVFRDKDSVDYIKMLAIQKFEEFDRHDYEIAIDDRRVYVSAPRYDFQNATVASMVEYIRKIETWEDVHIPGTELNARDVFATLAVFSVMKPGFLASNETIVRHYRGLAGSFIQDFTVEDFFRHAGLIDGSTICTRQQFVDNAIEIHRLYHNKVVQVMEQEYKFSDLVNNEFGCDAQYIQADRVDVGRGSESIPRFKSFTKRIIKENVVLGGLFSYVKDIRTKRKLSSNLGTQRNVIFNDFISSDYKYK